MQYLLRVMQEEQLPYVYALEAGSAKEAAELAEQQGLIVLNINQKKTDLFKRTFTAQHANFPLILFCQEFTVLFDAGLSVIEVLQTLIAKENNQKIRHVLQVLLNAVSEGKPLSMAMSYASDAFPPLFVATVSAAETTGDLSEVLMRYGQYLESLDALKKKIVSATLYPAIVTSFGLIVFVFLITFVIPKFNTIYATQVKEVSVITQLLLSLGNFSQQYGILILAILITLIFLSWRLLASETNRGKLSNLIWHMPYIGEHIRVYFLARFYRTFSMLLKSGIPVKNSLGMVDNLLGRRLKENITQAKQAISEGKSFSDALMTSHLTTAVSIRLMHVGERTGTLPEMMARAAQFHEEQMVRNIDRFTKVFEPVLMAMIGLMIGGIVLMMYIPIFELASGIQ